MDPSAGAALWASSLLPFPGGKSFPSLRNVFRYTFIYLYNRQREREGERDSSIALVSV